MAPPSLALPIILGVVISINFFSDSVFLSDAKTWCLILKIDAVFWFRISSARVFSLLSIWLSSLPIGSIGSGWTAFASMLISFALISYSKSLARVSCTLPVTLTTLCLVIPSTAFVNSSVSMICVIPVTSRKVRKVILPIFLKSSTQPARITSWSFILALTSSILWVRLNSMKSS